jgi:hypothetical protein
VKFQLKENKAILTSKMVGSFAVDSLLYLVGFFLFSLVPMDMKAACGSLFVYHSSDGSNGYQSLWTSQ